jgi:membrane associated rhomboid family serine protease
VSVEPSVIGESLAKTTRPQSLPGRFGPIIALVGVCWVVFVVNNLLLGGHLIQYGLVPRRISSLPGILWSPFLHGSLRHLTANSLPLLILGAIICGRSTREFLVVAFGGIVLSGGLTWLFGRNAYHIGASGLVFCFFGYLASLAYFRRSVWTLLVSVVCIVGYGGMLRGIFPGSQQVSWEAHLAGLLSGIVLASLFSNRKRRGGSDLPSATSRALEEVK